MSDRYYYEINMTGLWYQHIHIWIHIAQDNIQWQAFVLAMLNFWFLLTKRQLSLLLIEEATTIHAKKVIYYYFTCEILGFMAVRMMFFWVQ